MSHDNADFSCSIAEDSIERWLVSGLELGRPAAVDVWDLMVVRGWRFLHQCLSADGQRIVICPAREADKPALHLTPQQFQMVRLCADGLATKEIGAELGVLAATVRGTLRRAVQRLGLRAAASLPAFWRALNQAPCSFELEPGVELLVFEFKLAPKAPPVSLTKAERAIISLLLTGASNAEIAVKRSTSVRTVANQVAVIFRKFGVSSRGELAARALGAPLPKAAN